MVVLRTTTFQNIVVLTEYLVVLTPKKNVGFPVTLLVYFVVPMNAAVHVMCFYYSSWNNKIYANIKISKVGKTWLSACTPVYSFSVVRTADTGHADTRFLQPCLHIPIWGWFVWFLSISSTRHDPVDFPCFRRTQVQRYTRRRYLVEQKLCDSY